MEAKLKKLFLVVVVISIPIGLFIGHDHVHYFWHKIPSFEAIFGFLGAILLLGAALLLGAIARKKEDFYD
ncbi:MAG TPA: hypothetical protein ENN18_08595 [Proteobacteria bacterium]|nr:hypothetical protein [Pseudomonadota bacterium]